MIPIDFPLPTVCYDPHWLPPPPTVCYDPHWPPPPLFAMILIDRPPPLFAMILIDSPPPPFAMILIDRPPPPFAMILIDCPPPPHRLLWYFIMWPPPPTFVLWSSLTPPLHLYYDPHWPPPPTFILCSLWSWLTNPPHTVCSLDEEALLMRFAFQLLDHVKSIRLSKEVHSCYIVSDPFTYVLWLMTIV